MNASEDFYDLNFSDVNSQDYFTTKMSSNFIKFTANTNNPEDIPVFGVLMSLTGGSDDYEGITRSHAVDGIEEFSNPERYDINLIVAPDFPGDKVVANKLIQMCESRGDCMAVLDPMPNLTVQQVIDWSNGEGQWSKENALNSRFAALYYPWVLIHDSFTNSDIFVPPSVKIVGVYAYSDSVSVPWFAPAGLNRGRLFNTMGVERQLTVGDREFLYKTPNSVNPIVDFTGDGIVVWGQKTLQRKPSATDRVNVSRMLIYVAKILATATKYLVFEPSDEITWIQYKQLVNPAIEDVKSRRGLMEYKIVCDKSTNTPYVIDNNEMVADIIMKPTKSAERIITRFVITSSGANLDSITYQQ
jgi:phage tail sheath protein FI